MKGKSGMKEKSGAREKSKVKIIRNGKKRGEWAELVFAGRVVELGMLLSKPWGESSGYDFGVEQESGGLCGCR